MPLPKINHPIHEVYLRSLDRKVKFRPFLVKEEKLLLMAKQGDEAEEIIKTIKQIISNCLLEPVDVEKLPIFDIEMFFINLRIRSISESAEMVFTCDNVIQQEDGSLNNCGNKIEFNLDLNKVAYTDNGSENNQTIKLSDTVGIKFNYPSLNLSDEDLINSFEDGGYRFISQYVDYIYDSQEIHKKEEISEEELKDFFDQLTMDQIKSIRSFFENTPKVFMKQDIVCPRCSHVHHLSVEGLINFFG